MSKDKRKSLARQSEILKLILKRHKEALEYSSRARPRLYLNCEGGMAADNKDLLAAIENGFVTLHRSPGIPKWSRKFYNRPRHFNSTEFIRLSYVEITEKGRRYVE